MKKAMAVIFLLGFSLAGLLSCSAPKKSPEEAAALSALENIQTALESNTSYDQLVALLAVAKAKVEQLKQMDKKNNCFLSAVEKGYASYDIARKAWKLKKESTDPKRKQDLDMTYGFSLSFAALSIKKANGCYQ